MSTIRTRITTSKIYTYGPDYNEAKTAHSTLRAQKHPSLLSFQQIPHWHQDNEYILHGYRAPSGSIWGCFHSRGYLHNETGNIITHLIPGLCFVGGELFVYRFFLELYPEATRTDVFVFAFFLLSAAVCMGLSTGYHTLMNHSENISTLWLRIDYLGIIGLIFGNFISGLYMVFYCEPKLVTFYWSTTSALMSFTCIILLHPKFQGRAWRTFRATTFVCTGFSSLVPLAHASWLYGAEHMFRQSGLPYYILEGVLHVLGVVFYVTRIPESIKPGRFDIWGNSHQVFHVLVVLATMAQFFGIWNAFDYNYTNRTCQTSPQ